MSQKLYRAFRFSTHTYIANVLTRTDFRYGWAIVGPLQTLGRGILAELPASGKFSELAFYMFWDMNLKPGIDIGRWHDTSSLRLITIRSLWPTLRPKIGQIRFSIHSLINYMNPQNLALTLKQWAFGPYYLTIFGSINLKVSLYTHVTPEWGPCGLLHALSLGTVN